MIVILQSGKGDNVKLWIQTIIQILSAMVDAEKLIWKTTRRIQVNIPKCVWNQHPDIVFHVIWSASWWLIISGEGVFLLFFLVFQHKDRLAIWPRGWPLSWRLVFVAGEVCLLVFAGKLSTFAITRLSFGGVLRFVVSKHSDKHCEELIWQDLHPTCKTWSVFPQKRFYPCFFYTQKRCRVP